MVKNRPAMQETWVRPLEKGMATHPNILAWRIPWTEEPGGLLPIGPHRVGQGYRDLAFIVKGSGNPLQYSCPENPKDRGDWWAAVYAVTQSRTQLK